MWIFGLKQITANNVKKNHHLHYNYNIHFQDYNIQSGRGSVLPVIHFLVNIKLCHAFAFFYKVVSSFTGILLDSKETKRTETLRKRSEKYV